MPEKLKNTITDNFVFGFLAKLAQQNHIIIIIVILSFSKGSIFKRFSSTRNEKSAFSNSSSLKSVFEKLCFRDGLASVNGKPTVELKMRFQISPAQCGRDLK